MKPPSMIRVIAATLASALLAGCAGKAASTPPPANNNNNNTSASFAASVTVTPASGAAPLPVSASVSTTGGTMATVRIDFGDGTTVNSSSASHTYSTAGTFIVTATATSSTGDTGTANKSVTVSAAPAGNKPPVAKLAVTPPSGFAPLAVSASTAGSSDPDGTIARVSIDFGDGTVVNSASGSHTYTALGSYTVTATVTDNLGLSASAVSSVVVSSSTGWQPPIGIPAPPFGIVETAPAVPNPWTTATNGFYYVCPSCAGASDTHGLGTPAQPRATIPTNLPAGAVVEVHGTYTTDHGEANMIVSNGTAANPVFIRGADNGVNRPTLTKGLSIYGSYAVVENILFDHRTITAAGTGVGIGLPNGDSAAAANCATQQRPACADHIVFRHNELEGSTGATSFNACGGLGVGGWMTDLPTGSNQQYIVFWDNNIHDEGQMNPTTDLDQSCTVLNVGRYANHVWILDNSCTNVGQSCVQIVPTNDGSAFADVHDIYVGRNNSNRASKNAFWCKAATDVIFSQNIAHDTVEKSYNPSTGFGLQYGPQRVWFLFNEAYNVTGGIWLASDNLGGPDQRYFLIGNVIHDITNGGDYFGPWDPTQAWSSAGIFDATGAEVHSVNNVIWNLNQANGVSRPTGGGSHELVNNIIGGFQQATSRAIYFESSTNFTASTIDNNDIATLDVWNAGTHYTALSAIQSAGKCAHCISTDPLFTGAATNDFHLQATSPAVDKGAANSVYTTFFNLYGLSIQKDFSGAARPQGAGWDMGAFER